MKKAVMFVVGLSVFSFCSIIALGEDSAPDQTPTAGTSHRQEVITAENGKYKITIDTSQTPELTRWAHEKLAPAVQEWYPKIVKMLPSPGYKAPRSVTIGFYKMQGSAHTVGTCVSCGFDFFRKCVKNKKRAIGIIIHELVHVVQQPSYARHHVPHPNDFPLWLTEGTADYVRFYKYDLTSHETDISKEEASRVKCSDGYRKTANFLNWVSKKYDKDIVDAIAVAQRAGNYTEDLWKKRTGHTIQELNDEWKADLAK